MIWILFSLFRVTSPLRLLFYVPTLSYSHVAFNAELAEKLVDQGHHVTMIQAVIDDSINFNSTRFEIIRKYVGVPSGQAKDLLWSNPGPFEEASPLDLKILWKLVKVSNMFVKACGALMEDSVFLEEIRSRKFDVGFLEQYDSCGFGFFSAARISQVSWLSATLLFSPQPSSLGVDQPLSYVPELFLPSYRELSLLNRIQNILVSLVTSRLFDFTRSRQNTFFKGRFGLSSKFDLEKSAYNMTSSFIINSSPFFDLAFPQSTEFSHLIGASFSSKKLDKFWSTVASRGEFVLVSFGSIASFSAMPRAMKEDFLETFSLFPNTTFIVKWEGAPSPLPDNIIVSDWLPQKELMSHRNFKTMITHGGWSSILECIMAGRPLILMPLFADHWRNSRVVLSRGVGIVLEKTDVSVEKLATGLEEVLQNESFTRRSQKMAAMLSSSRHFNFPPPKVKRRHFSRPQMPSSELFWMPILIISLLYVSLF